MRSLFCMLLACVALSVAAGDLDEEKSRALIIEKSKANEERMRAYRERQKRRDADWQKLYQPSDFCKRNSAEVECANEYIRAKRAIEAKYGDW